MTRRARRSIALGLAAAAGVLAVVFTQAPGIAAGALLHPHRTPVSVPAPHGCETVRFAGDGLRLAGWRCASEGPRRGTIVYLHGVADNRASGRGVVSRYRAKGFDVVAYDSRAHGDSEGDFCTYGFFETRDLHRVIETLAPGPVVVIGTSLGGAVALQHAADEPRVTAVVAAEVFSDLRTVATERAPFFLPGRLVEQAFRVAEARAAFRVAAVSPIDAARRVRVPVLLIHGARDTDTPPSHSRRVHEALAGPKRLILVEGAAHNQSLSDGAVWNEIDRWIEAVART